LTEKAIDAYRTIIRLKADDFRAHNALGVALQKLGRHNEAIVVLQKVVMLNKNDHVAYHRLGLSLFARDRLDDAIAAYRAALRLREDFIQVKFDLGVALHRKGNLTGASAAFRESSQGFSAAGLLNEAIDAHKKLIELSKQDPGAHYNLGNDLKRKGLL